MWAWVSEWARPIGRASGAWRCLVRPARVPFPGRSGGHRAEGPRADLCGVLAIGRAAGAGRGRGGPTRNIPQLWAQCWRGLECRDHMDGHVLLEGPRGSTSPPPPQRPRHPRERRRAQQGHSTSRGVCPCVPEEDPVPIPLPDPPSQAAHGGKGLSRCVPTLFTPPLPALSCSRSAAGSRGTHGLGWGTSAGQKTAPQITAELPKPTTPHPVLLLSPASQDKHSPDQHLSVTGKANLLPERVSFILNGE